MKGCHLILRQVLCELSEIEGLVAYSLYQLPEDGTQRKKIYEQILREKKSMHFAVEGLIANTQQGCQKIETLWRIKLTLPDCSDGIW